MVGQEQVWAGRRRRRTRAANHTRLAEPAAALIGSQTLFVGLATKIMLSTRLSGPHTCPQDRRVHEQGCQQQGRMCGH